MRFLLMLICIVLLISNMVGAQKLELKPFVYTQDFEDQDPVSKDPWAIGAKYTVNFQGLTTEKAHSGKQSYKIDVTFDEGRYLYFGIPIKIPVQGQLKFSAWVYVPDENQGTAGPGFNYIFPPSPNSGCSPLSTLATTNGEWKQVQGDLLADGKQSVSVVVQYMWGISTDEIVGTDKSPIGIYTDRIGIFMYGDTAKRTVIYLDDIKIEGEVPDSESYDEVIQSRWANVKNKITKKIASWDTALASASSQLSNMDQVTGEAAELRKDALTCLTNAQARLTSAKAKPYLEIIDQTFIDSSIKQLNSMQKTILDITSGKIKFNNIRVTIIPPVTDNKILPSDNFIAGTITDTINLSACPGQYVPGSFVVRSSTDLNALKVKASNLKNAKNTIQASSVNIKLVKCWYQAGSAWSNIGQDKLHRILVPELLLNDDRLVKVDYEKQDNYVRGNFQDGEKYLWISDASKSTSDMGTHSVQDFPITDAPNLMPMSLNARTNQQFWITIKVPEKTQPGKYSGKITLTDGDKTLGDIKLNLTVLPFKLDAPYYVSSIYYRGVLGKDWKNGSISSEYKSEEQLKNELKNMIEHGVDNPTVYQNIGDTKLLGRYLTLFREAGWKGTSLYFLGTGVGSFKFTTPEGLEEFRQSCVDAKQFSNKYGVKNLYVYGIDEATGEVLASQRKAFAAAHEVGVKLFVAGYGGTFAAVGDLLDILVYAGAPSKKEAKQWHSKKHAIWSYANPQGGAENPLVYRRNFGLLLWKQNFDGACTYAYQHAFGNIWNDFDDITYRDHNFTYPTTTGVIDTIAWEGYREGVTDVRYLTTLLNAIKKAKAAGKITQAKAAEKYLNTMDIQNGDLDTLRAGMVKHIMVLRK